jgi:hypothetical protein
VKSSSARLGARDSRCSLSLLLGAFVGLFDNNLTCPISHLLLYIHVRTRENEMKNTIQTDDLGLFALYFSAAAAQFSMHKKFFSLTLPPCVWVCVVVYDSFRKKGDHKKVIRRPEQIKIGKARSDKHQRTSERSASARSSVIKRNCLDIRARLALALFLFSKRHKFMTLLYVVKEKL